MVKSKYTLDKFYEIDAVNQMLFSLTKGPKKFSELKKAINFSIPEMTFYRYIQRLKKEEIIFYDEEQKQYLHNPDKTNDTINRFQKKYMGKNIENLKWDGGFAISSPPRRLIKIDDFQKPYDKLKEKLINHAIDMKKLWLKYSLMDYMEIINKINEIVKDDDRAMMLGYFYSNLKRWQKIQCLDHNSSVSKCLKAILNMGPKQRVLDAALEWTKFTETSSEFNDIITDLHKNNQFEEIDRIIKDTFDDELLAKYPETKKYFEMLRKRDNYLETIDPDIRYGGNLLSMETPPIIAINTQYIPLE